MRHPADLAAAFKYAELSSQAGDLEAAISTLERMLIFAPENTRLKIELGVLYFRLDSYEMARTYFEAALATHALPPTEQQKANLYIAEIDKRTKRFRGRVAFGTRFQTNANYGPSNIIVDYYGTLQVLPHPAILAQPDVNGFVSAQLHYRYPLRSQGDTFDVDVLGYGSLYAQSHEINTALAEITFGPDYSLGRFGVDGGDVAVYGILGGVAFPGTIYRGTAGFGLKLGKVFDAENQGELRVEYRYQHFEQSSLREWAPERTGSRIDLYGILQHAFNDRLSVFGAVSAVRQIARYDYANNWEYGGTVGAKYAFDSPVRSLDGRWTAVVSAGFLRRQYDAFDPHILPFQRDSEAALNASLTIPFANDWSMEAALGYRNVTSNNGVDAFNDTSLTISLAKSF